MFGALCIVLQTNGLSLAGKQPSDKSYLGANLPTAYQSIQLNYNYFLWPLVECNWLSMGFGVLRIGAIMPSSQYCSYKKNTLCQNKQWPGIRCIFQSRDNEVWLIHIKLNWASGTEAVRRAGWKPETTLFTKERGNLVFKEPRKISEDPLRLRINKVNSNSWALWIVMVLQKSSGSHIICKLTETTTDDAETYYWIIQVSRVEVWHNLGMANFTISHLCLLSFLSLFLLSLSSFSNLSTSLFAADTVLFSYSHNEDCSKNLLHFGSIYFYLLFSEQWNSSSLVFLFRHLENAL